MTTNIKDDRYRLIASLPDNWLEVIEETHVSQGFYEMSIYPDEATIYNGSDDELEAVLKKYGWDKLK